MDGHTLRVQRDCASRLLAAAQGFWRSFEMWHCFLGVLWLLAGFLLVVCGTTEWKPWQDPRDSEKKKKKAIVLAVVIGLGGLCTTLGWNEFSTRAQEQSAGEFRRALEKTNSEFRTGLEKSNLEFRHDLDQRDQKFKGDQEERDRQLRAARKNAIILNVAREWKLNELIRRRAPFTDFEQGNKDKIDAKLPMLMKFENLQSKIACTSDAFDWTGGGDQAFAICLVNYAKVIESSNQLFDAVNAGTFSLLQTEPHNKALSQAVFGERGAYPAFLAKHKALADLLKSDYKWVMDDIAKVASPTNGSDVSP